MSLAEPWEDLEAVRVRVPGKINLALCVGGRRPDGYHELATIFQAVSLYDEVAATSSDQGITCEVNGVEAHRMPPESANLAYRAAQLLKNEYGVSEGVHLVIEKRIPIAGGMAGGSADAAGALMACSRLWGLKITMAELMQLGARLGADVPFPLMGGCAIGLGRGETLTPTLSRGSFHWVLAFATHQLPTPDVFRRFDEIAETMGQVLPAVPAIPAPLMMALTAGDTHRVASHLVNDLAPAACSLAPQLHATLAAGREAGCLAAMISGSGPTVAFLVEDELTATDLAVNLSSQGIARDVRMVTGPVPGAAIVNR